MADITSDQQLRAVLEQLPAASQRTMAAIFADQVGSLIRDPRLRDALRTALDHGTGEQERRKAYHRARSIATENYTACGQNVDWRQQAEHFVAAACVNALAPDRPDAWKAAIHARMADNCMQLAGDDGIPDLPVKQYRAAAASGSDPVGDQCPAG